MPPSTRLRPSGIVSMVAYQRSAASVEPRFDAASVVVENSPLDLPLLPLPPEISSLPSSCQVAAAQKLLTGSGAVELTCEPASKPFDGSQMS